jgi:hypothetical protein
MNRLFFALALLLASQALALAGTYAPVTAGVADSTALASRTTYNSLDIVNNSTTATVCVNFGAVATISSGVCAAGEITLPPLWHRSWDVPMVPVGDVHVISSAASTPVSIGAN